MELLYLWIEDYKNIYRQGFNFSPLYDFEFIPTKEENGKVIEGTLKDNITEKETKEKFYKDFFNVKNEKDDKEIQKGTITNVTAIVGENGAGKSSVLEFLSINSTNEYSYIQIVKKNKKVKIINNKVKVESLFSSVLPSIEYSILKYEYFTTPSDINRNNSFNWIQMSVNQLYEINDTKLLQDNRRLNSEKVFVQTNFLIQNNILKIDSLNVDVKNIDMLGIIKSLDEESMEYDAGFDPRIHEINLENREKKSNNFNEYKEYVYKCLYELMVTKIHKVIVHVFNDVVILSEIEQQEFEFILDPRYIINKKNNTHNYKTYIQDYLFCFDRLNIKRHFDFLKHIILLLEIIDLLEERNYDEINECITFDIESNCIKKFVSSYDSNFYFFDFEFKKDSQIQYLSRGEDALLFQLSTLQNLGKSNTKASIMILIDEGELGLHPQWQKQYLKILLETLPKIFPNKQIQLILTSHSPFLVSDLPKENVIFLEKGEDGKCIVAQPTAMKQTFGANIHTLLTNSFFIKDGLTGTFAQEKIDKVIDLLNQTEELMPDQVSFCEEMIKRIGEPIVKNTLQKLLDSKRLRKVDEHDTRIKELENELKSLKDILNQNTKL